MQIYKVFADDGEGAESFHGTRDEAHREAKRLAAINPNDIGVHLLEVQTDKEGVLAMLHGEPIASVIRRFGLTDRGGLYEIGAEPAPKQERIKPAVDTGYWPFATKPKDRRAS